MTTATAEFVPLNDFAIGGGGLIDDCDAKLTRVRFVTKTDLGGKPLEKPSLYLEVDYAVERGISVPVTRSSSRAVSLKTARKMRRLLPSLPRVTQSPLPTMRNFLSST